METLLDDEYQQDKQSKNSIILSLPYASSVYYKGIFSIPLAISTVGFIYSIYLINIAITRGNEMKRLYRGSEDKYDANEYAKVLAGMRYARISIAILAAEIAAFLIFSELK